MTWLRLRSAPLPELGCAGIPSHSSLAEQAPAPGASPSQAFLYLVCASSPGQAQPDTWRRGGVCGHLSIPMPWRSRETGRVAEKTSEHLPGSRVDAAVVFGSCSPQTRHSSTKILLLLGPMNLLVHGWLPSHGCSQDCPSSCRGCCIVLGHVEVPWVTWAFLGSNGSSTDVPRVFPHNTETITG